VATSSKRERELARMRAQRQAARRAAAEEARLRRRNSLIAGLAALAVVGVIVLIAYATKDGKKTVRLGAEATCKYESSGKAAKKVSGKPDEAQSTKGTLTAALDTSQGAIKLELDRSKAPCTVGSWGFLAEQAYFDDTTCHRLTTSGIFVLQCGDPSGSGSGGPGYQFGEENLDAFGTGQSVVYPRGTIAMANAGAGTNGSQFFLVYKDSPLPPNYTPFGTITEGLDVLDKVAKAGATGPAGDGGPKLPVKITKVTLGD
jgi:peptidyl-prolyl cis-trans isomerase B (cyclophilin B)